MGKTSIKMTAKERDEFVARVEALRTKHGVTLWQLAKAMGFSRMNVYNVLNRQQSVSARFVSNFNRVEAEYNRKEILI
jgi:transcriptional regulator with XRE-family HTH domain